MKIRKGFLSGEFLTFQRDPPRIFTEETLGFCQKKFQHNRHTGIYTEHRIIIKEDSIEKEMNSYFRDKATGLVFGYKFIVDAKKQVFGIVIKYINEELENKELEGTFHVLFPQIKWPHGMIHLRENEKEILSRKKKNVFMKPGSSLIFKGLSRKLIEPTLPGFMIFRYKIKKICRRGKFYEDFTRRFLVIQGNMALEFPFNEEKRRVNKMKTLPPNNLIQKSAMEYEENKEDFNSVFGKQVEKNNRLGINFLLIHERMIRISFNQREYVKIVYIGGCRWKIRIVHNIKHNLYDIEIIFLDKDYLWVVAELCIKIGNWEKMAFLHRWKVSFRNLHLKHEDVNIFSMSVHYRTLCDLKTYMPLFVRTVKSKEINRRPEKSIKCSTQPFYFSRNECQRFIFGNNMNGFDWKIYILPEKSCERRHRIIIHANWNFKRQIHAQYSLHFCNHNLVLESPFVENSGNWTFEEITLPKGDIKEKIVLNINFKNVINKKIYIDRKETIFRESQFPIIGKRYLNVKGIESSQNPIYFSFIAHNIPHTLTVFPRGKEDKDFVSFSLQQHLVFFKVNAEYKLIIEGMKDKKNVSYATENGLAYFPKYCRRKKDKVNLIICYKINSVDIA